MKLFNFFNKKAEKKSIKEQELFREEFWRIKCQQEPGCIGCKIYDL